MAPIAAMPTVSKVRDYSKIPSTALNAIVDMMELRANGTVEVHFAAGGVAKVYVTKKETYQ